MPIEPARNGRFADQPCLALQPRTVRVAGGREQRAVDEKMRVHQPSRRGAHAVQAMLACASRTITGRRCHGPLQAALLLPIGKLLQGRALSQLRRPRLGARVHRLHERRDAGPQMARKRQCDGRGAGAGGGRQEARAIGRHPDLPRREDRQVCPGQRGRAAGSAALDAVRQPQVHGQLRDLPLLESRSCRPRPIPPCWRSSRAASTARSASSRSTSGKSKFIVGDKPTIADFSLAGYMFYPPEESGYDWAKSNPNLHAWIERLRALPGWKDPYEMMPGEPHQAAQIGSQYQPSGVLQIRWVTAVRKSLCGSRIFRCSVGLTLRRALGERATRSTRERPCTSP